jgi:hypothetical protein
MEPFFGGESEGVVVENNSVIELNLGNIKMIMQEIQRSLGNVFQKIKPLV